MVLRVIIMEYKQLRDAVSSSGVMLSFSFSRGQFSSTCSLANRMQLTALALLSEGHPEDRVQVQQGASLIASNTRVNAPKLKFDRNERTAQTSP